MPRSVQSPLVCLIGADGDACYKSHMCVWDTSLVFVGGRLPGIVYSISNVNLGDTVILIPLLCVHDLKINLETLCHFFDSSWRVLTSLCFADLETLACLSWFLLGIPESQILVIVM